MYFRNLVSSGSGTLNLTNMALEFDIEQDSDEYRGQVDKLYDNNILRTNFCDVFNISNSVTLTAGTNARISLQNITYKCPFIFFMIRSNVASTNNGYMNFVSLGGQTDSTQLNVQVQTASAYDILNNGQGLAWTDFALLNSTYFDNDLFTNQNIYPIIFTKNVKRSLLGDQSAGFYQFDGSNYQLQLNPGSSFPSGTYQVDIYVYYFRCIEIASGRLSACSYYFTKKKQRYLN